MNTVDAKDHVGSMVEALIGFQAAMPPSGPRNRNWLQKFETLHNTSQEYWSKTFDLYRTRFNSRKLRTDDVEISMQSLQFWKHTEYTAQLETKREQLLADTKKSKIPNSEDVFLPFPTKTEVAAKPDILPSKAKVKTRGEARLEEPTLDDETTIVQDATQAKITVPKRSYATFRYMFPTSLEERQKHVEWETFVTSMGDAGFSARDGGGSIVLFEANNGGGKIAFYKPHPEPSLDPVMLQSMGRRMNKWFDWTRDSFKLAGK